ncbi:activated RNA polymerase II transcriptional coactivator p15-like [Glandiceps talaboti]
MPKSKAIVSTDDSDSDTEVKPKAKKQKKVEKKKAAAADDGSEEMIQLSRMRYVNVRDFKGKVLVDIREYYDAGGELKPGRKGISLTREQWEKLKECVDEIDEKIADFS